LNLREVIVQSVCPSQERHYQRLMEEHHYLGALPKIGETIWYVASLKDQWVALISFLASAWKCAARDQWIGWNFRHQYDRLKLVVNNSRFLILPEWHIPNLGSRVLSLCEKKLPDDWQEKFGHLALLLETFVDPARFRGTVHKAANWPGNTKGFAGPGTDNSCTIARNGIPETFKARRSSPSLTTRSRPALSHRGIKSYAQCRPHEVSSLVFCRYS